MNSPSPAPFRHWGLLKVSMQSLFSKLNSPNFLSPWSSSWHPLDSFTEGVLYSRPSLRPFSPPSLLKLRTEHALASVKLGFYPDILTIHVLIVSTVSAIFYDHFWKVSRHRWLSASPAVPQLTHCISSVADVRHFWDNCVRGNHTLSWLF